MGLAFYRGYKFNILEILVAYTKKNYKTVYVHICITLLEKYPTFFLRNPDGFQWKTLAWGDLEPSYAYVNFFPACQ